MAEDIFIEISEIPSQKCKKEQMVRIKALSWEWGETEKAAESDSDKTANVVAKTYNKIVFTHDDVKAFKRLGEVSKKIDCQKTARLRIGAKFVMTFCGENQSYPVFRKELDFLSLRREKMKQACLWEKELEEHIFKNVQIQEVKEIKEGKGINTKWAVTLSFKDYKCKSLRKKERLHPTTENQLVGLCLSGGGIRSATFSLGFIQALFYSGLLQRVDYLSTVSGGGYIGSCMTALLSSDLKNTKNEDKKPGGLWEKKNFPFIRPIKKNLKKEERENIQSDQEINCEKQKVVAAEKKPVGHLRYYSNYLTAEGDFIQKYVGPVIALTRGFLFNMLLIAPIIILVAVLLSAIYKLPEYLPEYRIGPFPLFLKMQKMQGAWNEYNEKAIAYKHFVINSTKEFKGLSTGVGVDEESKDIEFKDRVEFIRRGGNSESSDLYLQIQEMKLNREVLEHANKIKLQFFAILVVPIAATVVMMLLGFFSMQFGAWSLTYRFKFSYFSACLIFVASVIFFIQLFGIVMVYWSFLFKLPWKFAPISLLAILGPKILESLTIQKDGGNKPWIRTTLSYGLMALAPLILLYITGWMVRFLWSTQWDYSVWFTVGGVLLLYVTNRFFNINRISLHEFYRDRLCRAFLIQHDNSQIPPMVDPFEKIKANDQIRISGIYEAENTTGPYHIINTNLNQTKSLPHRDLEGVFRTGESFILSKYWCGSEKTGYVDTAYYQEKDSHLNLGTAMAISGAAANVGMGQSNLPGLRLLLCLLNIRLGYWALNPKKIESKGIEGKSPGGMTAFKEWLGMYARENRFINLSDGGHFDNLGIYELLKRRCKYIIVADAEADPLMRFQGLASIIRLARIDFGIEIDIDVSDLRPDKASNHSRKHCVVGTIRYPQIYESGQEEIGYLLYCKSTLTGREPQHLFSYRIKHPTFPHQTTADQWFDEEQFEVYRELGYNVGRESFKPVQPVTNETNMEEAFIQLKQHWHPSPPGMEERSTRYANELNQIIELIKSDTNLRFIDAQIFPEWKSLISHVVEPLDIELWLPERKDEVCAGFYVSSLMLQFMENVYIDLNLDDTYDHPGNRGWMNLFMHWAWSGMVRVTWAISACTFGGEFQKFCERHLRLDLGEIEANKILSEKDMEFDKDAENIFRSSAQMKEKLSTHLNPFEIIKIDKLLHDQKTKADCLPEQCYSFNMIIKNPLKEKQNKKFTFGFSLIRFPAGSTEILYFRIQDHLRRIGLGRLALGKLIDHLSQELVLKYSGKSKSEILDLIKVAEGSDEMGEAPEDVSEKKSFAKLLNSVKAEKQQAYFKKTS